MISKEQIQEAKRIDLLTYLQNYEPDNLVPVSAGTYSTKEHDSLKISNGLWYQWSSGIGGKSALDYLIKVRGLSLEESVQTILGYTEAHPPAYPHTEQQHKPKVFALSDCITPTQTVIQYLTTKRGIDAGIIHYCTEQGFILESIKHHNVVFVGYDETNTPRFGSFRACNRTRIMGELSGSNKAYSFRLIGNTEGTKVHLFESAIDLLSYATLLKRKGLNWKQYNLISLSGIHQPNRKAKKNKLPISLERYLDNNPQTEIVYIHLDNDKAGRLASRMIQTLLPKSIKVIDNPPPVGKDVNDFLLSQIRDNSRFQNQKNTKKNRNLPER